MKEIDTAEAIVILHELRSLTGPSRDVDARIASFCGFEKVEGETTVWLDFETKRAAKLPRFTAVLSNAYDFAQFLLPGHVGACTWGGSIATARIEPGREASAANPALALCICALLCRIVGTAPAPSDGGPLRVG